MHSPDATSSPVRRSRHRCRTIRVPPPQEAEQRDSRTRSHRYRRAPSSFAPLPHEVLFPPHTPQRSSVRPEDTLRSQPTASQCPATQTARLPVPQKVPSTAVSSAVSGTMLPPFCARQSRRQVGLDSLTASQVRRPASSSPWRGWLFNLRQKYKEDKIVPKLR